MVHDEQTDAGRRGQQNAVVDKQLHVNIYKAATITSAQRQLRWATVPEQSGPKITGAAVSPFSGGRGGAGFHLTHCGLGRGLPPCQVASWSIQPFGHNRHGPKIGGCAPLGEGELSLYLTPCGQVRGLPPRQVSSWSIQPFGHNTPTLQTKMIWQTDRQLADSIGRIVLQTVAPKPWVYLDFGEG